MASLSELVDYLDAFLDTSRIPDYPLALNGLQMENSGSVRKIAAAVDFSTQVVDASIEKGADFLLVHHGMFWSGVQPITGPLRNRLRRLIESDVAVYASHLPLDAHPELGNNVLLARVLGLEPSAGFAKFEDIQIGVQGSTEIATAQLAERARRFSLEHGGNPVTTRIAPDRVTRRWGICTGAGATSQTLFEARTAAIDTLIVGEGAHWTAIEAAEHGISVIYAGHYATEILGVRRLAEQLADRFGLDWVEINAPTGL